MSSPAEDVAWNPGEVCAIDLAPLTPEQYDSGLCTSCAEKYCPDCWEWWDDCGC